jgi:hypothetical protein
MGCLRRAGLSEPIWVSIDVEGAELVVLRGMSRILRHMQPIIVLELESHLVEGCGTIIRSGRGASGKE